MKLLLKRGVFALAWLLALPLSFAAWMERRFWPASEGFFLFGAQCLALLPGGVGIWLRSAYYWSVLDEASWECRIGFGSILGKRSARVGRRVSIGMGCIFGHVQIGDGVMIGSRVCIPSGKRQHFDQQGRLQHEQVHYDTVRVGSGCWVGDGAVVLADVGDSSVVAAAAVVMHQAKAGSLLVGNPAQSRRSVDVAPANHEEA